MLAVTTMQTLLEQLLYDPDRYLAEIDADHLAFRQMDRASFASSIFLDQRIDSVDDVRLRAPIDALLTGVRALAIPRRRLGYIFHIAHCGSSLLARALDRNADNLVLREPAALRQLGVLAASSAPTPPPREWQAIAELVTTLLGKRYDPSAPVIVKANVPVNFMLDWLMRRHADTPAIMLYLGFEEYLLAVLRTNDHRIWVEQVGNELYPVLAPMLDPIDLLEPPRIAAALWLAQLRAFADILERYPTTRALNAEALFARPVETLTGAFALFDIDMSSAEIDAIATGPLFSTYAKSNGVAFDDGDRRRRRDADAVRLAPEIADAHAWLSKKLDLFPLPATLPRPLTIADGPLF